MVMKRPDSAARIARITISTGASLPKQAFAREPMQRSNDATVVCDTDLDCVTATGPTVARHEERCTDKGGTAVGGGARSQPTSGVKYGMTSRARGPGVGQLLHMRGWAP